MTWSHEDVATTAEIVACFNELEYDEILYYNWRTAPRDKQERWNVTKETYINGIMMTLDFDYRMGFLIQAVDRTSSQCTYIAITQYHGRRDDGSIEHDWCVWEGTHKFFGHEEGFSQVEICHWGVTVIHGMVEAHDEAIRKDTQ
jgi:hypothetical protein